MGQLKLAVVGAGYIGQAHMHAARQSKSWTLCAVADPSASAAALTQQMALPYYRSLDELLTHIRPDAIVLATPNALHVPQSLQCIEAGLPILLEKPIAPTVAEAQTLVAAVQARGGVVLIGHHRAHSPIMSKARQIVLSGQLGRLVAVQGSATFYKPVEYFESGPWRKELGGGPILLNMIHEVHNLRMLCGEISAVQAFKSHAIRGFAVEDTVAIALQFASGALGTFMLSDTAASARSWEQTSQENPVYPSYGDEDCYVLSGTNGTLSIPTMRLKLYPSEGDGSWWKPFEVKSAAMQREDPIHLQLEHFAAVVRGECAPEVSALDGLNNLRVTEAIVQAAQSGHTVTLKGTP